MKKILAFSIISLLIFSCTKKHTDDDIRFYNKIIAQNIDHTLLIFNSTSKEVRDNGNKPDDIVILNKMTLALNNFQKDLKNENFSSIKKELAQKLDTSISEYRLAINELEYFDKTYNKNDTIDKLKYTISLYSSLNLFLLEKSNMIGAACLRFDKKALITYNKKIKNDTLEICLLPNILSMKFNNYNIQTIKKTISITDLETGDKISFSDKEIGFSTIISAAVKHNRNYLFEASLIIKNDRMYNYVNHLYVKDTLKIN